MLLKVYHKQITELYAVDTRVCVAVRVLQCFAFAKSDKSNISRIAAHTKVTTQGSHVVPTKTAKVPTGMNQRGPYQGVAHIM